MACETARCIGSGRAAGPEGLGRPRQPRQAPGGCGTPGEGLKGRGAPSGRPDCPDSDPCPCRQRRSVRRTWCRALPNTLPGRQAKPGMPAETACFLPRLLRQSADGGRACGSGTGLRACVQSLRRGAGQSAWALLRALKKRTIPPKPRGALLPRCRKDQSCRRADAAALRTRAERALCDRQMRAVFLRKRAFDRVMDASA